MSGGVDSSLAAALLLEQGYEVIGAFMKNWSGRKGDEVDEGLEGCGEDEGSEGFSECGWRTERRDAMRVASRLGIPFVTLDFEKEYRALVVEDLFREYAAGRTPNPDVLCNKHVKFDLFVRAADALGCAFVATGHYARIKMDGSCRGALPSSPAAAPRPCDDRELAPCHPSILVGSDPNKDQTYFLWAVPPAVLPRVLFPIGHLRKPDVRRMAEARGLATAHKKDSTGICFVGDVDMKAFLKTRIKEAPGDIVATDGHVIGRHDGLAFFTIGQRHGIQVGGGTPYYVVGKDAATNRLIVSDKENPALFRRELTAVRANWFRMPIPTQTLPCDQGRDGAADGDSHFRIPVTFRCTARVRYRQTLAPCTVSFPLPSACASLTRPLLSKEGQGVVAGDALRVVFDEPQRAVTPGQSVVFYDGEEMLGGAVIE